MSDSVFFADQFFAALRTFAVTKTFLLAGGRFINDPVAFGVFVSGQLLVSAGRKKKRQADADTKKKST